MPEAVRGLERFNRELLDLESHLLDLLLALQSKQRKPKPKPGRKPPRIRPRHPSGGFPGVWFGGKGGG